MPQIDELERESPEATSPTQFTLGTMMWFVFGASVFLSQLGVLVVGSNGRLGAAQMEWGLILGWTLMIVFYIRCRRIGVIFFHCLLPILFLLSVDVSFRHLAFAAWGSTLLTFPSAVILELMFSDVQSPGSAGAEEEGGDDVGR